MACVLSQSDARGRFRTGRCGARSTSSSPSSPSSSTASRTPTLAPRRPPKRWLTPPWSPWCVYSVPNRGTSCVTRTRHSRLSDRALSAFHSPHSRAQASLSLWLAIFYFTVTGVFVWFDHMNGPQAEHQTPVADEVRAPTHKTQTHTHPRRQALTSRTGTDDRARRAHRAPAVSVGCSADVPWRHTPHRRFTRRARRSQS